MGAVLTFVGVGAWAASLLPYPNVVGTGAGLALGTLSAYLLLHVSGPAATPPSRPPHATALTRLGGDGMDGGGSAPV